MRTLIFVLLLGIVSVEARAQASFLKTSPDTLCGVVERIRANADSTKFTLTVRVIDENPLKIVPAEFVWSPATLRRVVAPTFKYRIFYKEDSLLDIFYVPRCPKKKT